VRLFADDCLLYREIRTFQDHVTLQNDLRQLEGWALAWGMRFNAKKCYVLRMRQKTTYTYVLDSELLKVVSNNPYLGIIISDDLKWHDHVTHVAKKANTTLGFIRRNLRHCPRHCRRTAYIALVRSIMDYGAVVWDPYHQSDINKLERIQHRAARFITGDYRSRTDGCVSAMLEDLQLQSLQERRRRLRLSYFGRVVEGTVPALPSVNFLQPQRANKRRVQPRKFNDCVTSNIIERQACNNSICFIVPQAKTEQYKNSFFVRTTVEWNNSSDSQIKSTVCSLYDQ
jgi:hypothetical protein